MRVVTGEAKGRKLKGPKTIGTRPIIDRVKQALFNIIAARVEDARFLDLFAGTGSVGIEALSRGAASATFIELNYTMLALVRENLQITGLADRAETIHADAFKFLQNGAPQARHKQGKRSVEASTGETGSLVIPPKSARPREAGGLDDGAPEILRAAQDDKTPGCHPEQREGSLADFGGITRGNVSDAIAPYDIIYVAPQYQEMAARALGMLDSSPLVSRTGLVIVQIHPKERAGVVAVPLTRLALTDERRYGSTLLMFYAIKEEQS